MRILKFGGAALRNGPSVREAALIVREFGGERPVIVVSAHAGVTSQLERAVDAALEGRLDWDPLRIRHRTLLAELELPGDLLDPHLRELRGILERLRADRRADRRFRDFVLSFGERMSTRVFAAALRRDGFSATPLDAHDLGLVSTGGRLGAPNEASRRVLAPLDAVSGVPVITGFLALDGDGYLTTLGRNGSDLTATWFGAAVRADEVQLWKRVPGVMTADPHWVPGAHRMDTLGWSEAEDLARHGSCVLHAGAVEPAHGASVPIHVRDFDEPASAGTRIAGDRRRSGVTGLAQREDVALLRVGFEAGRGQSAQLLALFDTLAAEGLEPFVGSIDSSGAELLLPSNPRLEGVIDGRIRTREIVRQLATVTLVGSDLDRESGVDEAIAAEIERGAREFHAGADDPKRSRVLLLESAAMPATLRRLHAQFFE